MTETRKNEMEKIYKEIKFTKTLAKNQTVHRLFNGYTKFYCTITYNGKKYSRNFQCNTSFSKTNNKTMKQDFLNCTFLDAFAYINNQNIYDFANELGYDYDENPKKIQRIYTACEKAYNKLYDMFGEDFDDLSEYIEKLNY